MPNSALVGGISPGSTYEASPAAVLIGFTMDNPFGPWPDLVFGGPQVTMPGVTFQDHDGDGIPGVTAFAKTLATARVARYCAHG